MRWRTRLVLTVGTVDLGWACSGEVSPHDQTRHPARHGVGGADDPKPGSFEHRLGPHESHGQIHPTWRVDRSRRHDFQRWPCPYLRRSETATEQVRGWGGFPICALIFLVAYLANSYPSVAKVPRMGLHSTDRPPVPPYPENYQPREANQGGVVLSPYVWMWELYECSF